MNSSVYQPSALVYPPITSQCKNILLIDKSVTDAQLFASSVNETTFPIIYSSTSTKSELLKVLQRNFVIIERIGFVFASNAGNIKTFLDGQQFFMNEEPVSRPYSENVDFLISIIKEFKVKSIDFLACNTLNYSNWENYYGILTKETGVVIGASNDKTGNIKYGGDWIMESTSQNIELIYFTQSVEYYSYLLDNIPIWTTTGGWPMGSAISGGYLYVALNTSGRIGKISLTNPYGDNNQVWATTGTSPT